MPRLSLKLPFPLRLVLTCTTRVIKHPADSRENLRRPSECLAKDLSLHTLFVYFPKLGYVYRLRVARVFLRKLIAALHLYVDASFQ